MKLLEDTYSNGWPLSRPCSHVALYLQLFLLCDWGSVVNICDLCPRKQWASNTVHDHPQWCMNLWWNPSHKNISVTLTMIHNWRQRLQLVCKGVSRGGGGQFWSGAAILPHESILPRFVEVPITAILWNASELIKKVWHFSRDLGPCFLFLQ